ncbi:Late embryogenesis abundant protein [Quillaja saponaria]|uniref:Late embryogenesis abundant protein n=1 Tax=Quillaja saponaria TaxID=32244 RepID=A0AAD7L2F5_QUISA|nr:Late embryogenesis abundant protein [Quillaja saponaria]
MTENNQDQVISHKKIKRRRYCLIAIGALLLLIIIVALILVLTVFKPKQPRTQLLSATVEGIVPRVSFPAIRIQLNVTLDLKLLVENRNHASFKHGEGKSILVYKGDQVGEAVVYPGQIPARGSTTLPCRLTLQVDELAPNITSLIRDVLGGQLSMETHTKIPGKVSFFGIVRKHVVAVSECQFTIGIPDLKIRSQICKNKAKL